MNRRTRLLSLAALLATAGGLAGTGSLPVQSQNAPPKIHSSLNAAGELRTVFLNGAFMDRTNPFFKNIGVNGRSCATCHAPENAWTITPEFVQKRFLATRGLDPIFHPFDGTNSPNADLSTEAARRQASSLLLNKALIRVGIGIPAGAEFTLSDVDDPYHFANPNELSLFRRPMPTTNLRFLTGVMWDARESTPLTGTLPFSAGFSDAQNAANLLFNLQHQSNEATRGHARAARDLTDAERQAVVNFEMSLVTAQQYDYAAGELNKLGAQGGTMALASQLFYVTINDVLGADHFGGAFDSSAMTLYSGWQNSSNPARAQIARGAVLFNTKPIAIKNVAGLNDDLNLPVISGTCTTCHDSPNVGNHSVPLPINIGLADVSRRTPDMPLYTLRHKQTGETVQTTDPGRAMITGKWKDIGKFKGPVLRGLVARAPYFHNGFAAGLPEVVDFYDTRFDVGFTAQEKADLVAFLKTL